MRNPRLVLLTFIALFAAITLYAAVPATVTIGEAKAKQPAVTFDHAKHAETLVKTCDVCHHTQKGLTKDSKDEVKKCSSCHLDPKDPKAPSMREMSPTKNPFHIRCAGCHKAEKKGPTSCTACHKK